jgi:hypothetical protein
MLASGLTQILWAPPRGLEAESVAIAVKHAEHAVVKPVVSEHGIKSTAIVTAPVVVSSSHDSVDGEATSASFVPRGEHAAPLVTHKEPLVAVSHEIFVPRYPALEQKLQAKLDGRVQQHQSILESLSKMEVNPDHILEHVDDLHKQRDALHSLIKQQDAEHELLYGKGSEHAKAVADREKTLKDLASTYATLMEREKSLSFLQGEKKRQLQQEMRLLDATRVRLEKEQKGAQKKENLSALNVDSLHEDSRALSLQATRLQKLHTKKGILEAKIDKARGQLVSPLAVHKTAFKKEDKYFAQLDKYDIEEKRLEDKIEAIRAQELEGGEVEDRYPLEQRLAAVRSHMRILEKKLKVLHRPKVKKRK